MKNYQYGTHYPERTDEIIRLVKEGKISLQEIGNQFGISRERVRQIASKFGGVSRNNVPLPAVPRLGKRSKCFYCGAVIPIKLMRAHRFKNDEPLKAGAKLRPSDYAHIYQWYNEGWGYVKIGKKLNVTSTSIKHALINMGVTLHPSGQYDRSRRGQSL